MSEKLPTMPQKYINSEAMKTKFNMKSAKTHKLLACCNTSHTYLLSY